MSGTSDRVKGATEKGKGRVKQATGDLTNNQSLKNKGEAEEAKGSLRKGVGRVKDAVGDLKG